MQTRTRRVPSIGGGRAPAYRIPAGASGRGGQHWLAGAVSSPIPERGADRRGPGSYDDLEPELRRHAASGPGDPGYEVRRERLIREFLPLAQHLARRYSSTQSMEDVEQAGVVGLIGAIDRYDPAATTRGPLPYLVSSVRGAMLRHLRDHTWTVRVPRDLKDAAVRVNRASAELDQRLGRSPRPSELADELGLPVDTVIDTLAAWDAYRPASLDVPDPETGRARIELVGAEDTALDLVDHRGELRRRIGELPERERTILLLRFYGDQTQQQIAGQVGLSQMHVSRLLSRTLHRLRAQMSVDDDDQADPAPAPADAIDDLFALQQGHDPAADRRSAVDRLA